MMRQPRDAAGDPYAAFRTLLRELGESFAGKVLFLHGDSHRFRVDRPLLDARGARMERFTRVECFGPPWESSWVRIGVDPGAAEPWTVAVRHARSARP